MDLKQAQRKSLRSFATKNIWHNRRKRFISTALLIVLVFIFGVYVGKSGFLGNKVIPIAAANLRLIPNIIGGMRSWPERIIIDINYKNFQKLAYQREGALAKGILMTSPEDYVNASVRHGDRTIKVKLRLKGDETVHLEGSKWSFRVKVRGDNSLFGMKTFSLHHPRTRNYIYEWLFHQALKREGVISLRYEFVTVTLNGKDLGVYALEEHFEKRLIEHNRLREGPIVRFNENLFWAEKMQQRTFPNAELNDSGLYLSSDIDVFQTSKMLTDSSSYGQFTKAAYLLESFRRGELRTDDVFDVQKLARYFAITDLMGAQHGALWHNCRFYYNTITSRLEPIGFDGESGQPIEKISAMFVTSAGRDFNSEFAERIFSDLIFCAEYIRTLERISQTHYLDTLLDELNDGLRKNLNIIYREFPYYAFSRDVLYQNQRFIKMVLNPTKGLHAYFHESSNNHQIELELGNIQLMPIEVLSISYKNSLLCKPLQKTILPGKLKLNLVDYRNVPFLFPEDFAWADTMILDLRINYKFIGASQMRQESVFPWAYQDDYFADHDLIRQEPNVHDFTFLVTDESSKKIRIKPGVWNVDRSLMIPEGYRVICGEGTRLNLSNSATILSYSPLEFVGSEDYPVVIESTDSTGQGLVVLKADEVSVLDYVIFRNLSNPAQSGWELTGAVTFYESAVEIFHGQFTGNRSEDGLNIIRSEFTIEGTVFQDTFSDAFDADFSKGKITNTSFADCGNDAIDVSGTVIEIEDVLIDSAGDKGLSAGERSRMAARNIEIRNAEIAVASKDVSEIEITDIKITGGQIGFSAYQKKPEFGAATIHVEGLKMYGVRIPYLVEEACKMVVDGEVISSDRKNVKDILYGVEYGKSSK